MTCSGGYRNTWDPLNVLLYNRDAELEPKYRMADADADYAALQQAFDCLKRWTQKNKEYKWHEPTVLEDQQSKAKITVAIFTPSDQNPLFRLKSLFRDSLGFVYKVIPKSQAVLSAIRKNDRILSVNGIEVTGCDPRYVGQLLKLLVKSRKSFHLVLLREECDNALREEGDDTWCDVKFVWSDAGYNCIVTENNNGRPFKKCLNLLNILKPVDCFLVTAKNDWCVATDGERLFFEQMQDEQHCDSTVIAYQYCGDETDSRSRHCNAKDHLWVFGFKVRNIKSEIQKSIGAENKKADDCPADSDSNQTSNCLVATDNITLTLMDAGIPEHGKVLNTKADGRFFYTKVLRDKYRVFESTHYENHFLAVKYNTDDPCKAPELYLLKIENVTDAELAYHDDILFEVKFRQ